jgi:hypothetical protein
MTTPAIYTQISAQNINTELSRSATTTMSFNETPVRGLAGKTTDLTTISMLDLSGKSSRKPITGTAQTLFSVNTTQTTINIGLLPGYVAGKTDVTITVNSGVYVYSTSTSSAALTITGATTGDTVTLVNNGYIIGKGGDGGATTSTYAAGYAGGPAISLGCPITIANYRYIAGGGGGGAASVSGGGGGAGGGTGGTYPQYAGGAGGGPGAKGANAADLSSLGYSLSGGGGGRILPGTATPTGYYNYGGYGGDAGGASGLSLYYLYGYGVPTQGGGGAGNPGVDSPYSGNSGGGGGWGARGGHATPGGSGGGAGGAAVISNGNTVTWAATGTVYGAT